MRKKNILWNENGWTVIENASPRRHSLEVSCYAENGTVTRIITRHSDGEEENEFKGIKLPISLAELKDLVMKDEISFKP